MSGPLELYRTTVNLRGLGSGALIEIDPEDPAWAGDIAKKRIVKVPVGTMAEPEPKPETKRTVFGGAEDYFVAEVPVEPWRGQYATSETYLTDDEGDD